MNPLNLYKGYGQISHIEDQNLNKIPQFNPIKKPLITSLILLTLIIASLIVTLICHTSSSSLEQTPLNSLATESIQLVCNVTQYPNSCFSTLSSINTKSKPDPQFLFTLSLQSAINELEKLTSLPKSMSHRVNDSLSLSALEDCKSLFDDALSQLNKCELILKGHVAGFDWMRRNSDINTWVSAALTDQGTCLDGLEEIRSTVVNEVTVRMHASTVCLSNSLAILVNIMSLLAKYSLLDKFHV